VFRQIQQLLIDPMGRLDSAATVDALEREVEAHLSKLEEFDKLPVLPPPAPAPAAGLLTDRRASSPEVTSEDILRAFLDGAQLDFGREEIGELNRMFREIGEIVRESFEGAGNFLRSQVYFKTELRIERTMIAPRSNNPLKFVSDYRDVAKVLLLQRSEAFMDGPAAIRDALQNAQDSYLAQITAMRASVLKAFDILEASTADERDRGHETLWPWAEARRLRQVLQRHAQELAAMRQAFSDGESPIRDAYAQAYLAQIETLRADRGAKGKDAKAG
jgi:predicted component of type VI protein secretion system